MPKSTAIRVTHTAATVSSPSSSVSAVCAAPAAPSCPKVSSNMNMLLLVLPMQLAPVSSCKCTAAFFLSLSGVSGAVKRV
eukprot:2052402-Amphidinium_carterae.1